MRAAHGPVNRFCVAGTPRGPGNEGKGQVLGSEDTTASYSVPPVERAIRLLRYIGDRNSCRNLSTASRELGINRTTLIRLIHTLLDQRMIEEIGDGAGYRLGVGLVSLGAQALDGRDIVQLCQPILQELCEATTTRQDTENLRQEKKINSILTLVAFNVFIRKLVHASADIVL